MLATEIELAALHSQFVATSEEIAKDLALLAGRIDEEPTEVRASQLAAATEIAAAQERLRLEADRLEGPPEQCIAIMRAVLEAQQAAQLQLAVILKRHRPSSLLRNNLDERLANMARQLKASAAAPRSADESRVQLPTNVSGSEGQADNGELRSDHSNDDTPEGMQSPSMPLAAIIKAGTSLALLLAVASAGLALFFLYTSLPGARPHREVTAEQALRERRGRANTPIPSPEGEETGSAAQLAAVGSTEGPPKKASAALSPLTNASTPKPTAPSSTMSNAAGITPNVAGPAAGLQRSDAPAVPGILPDGRQPGISTTAAQPPTDAVLAPPSPLLSNDAEKFVPVVFTHKDKGTALRTFAELQRRYPKLMARRQSELQLVDTRKNGIWYRLTAAVAMTSFFIRRLHQAEARTCATCSRAVRI